MPLLLHLIVKEQDSFRNGFAAFVKHWVTFYGILRYCQQGRYKNYFLLSLLAEEYDVFPNGRKSISVIIYSSTGGTPKKCEITTTL